MVVGRELLALSFRIVVDDELKRTQHGDASLGTLLKILAQTLLEHGIVDPAARDLGDAAALCKILQALRRKAASTQTDDGRHAGIVPAVHVLFLHELNELSLAHDDVRQIQAIEFVLMREQEEIRANDVKRRLHERREVFREAKQRRKELRDLFVIDRLRKTTLPRFHQARKPLFRQTATQFGAIVKSGLDERHCTIVLAVGHRTDHLDRLFVLRGAQKRNDALKSPVVERALILELQRADGVRDVFERVFNRMRERVHRVHAPLVARRMMLGKANAVDGRVAKIDVGARHVDLGAHHHGTFGMLAVAHFVEKPQIFLGRAVAIG